MNKNLLKNILAVIVGFAVIVILSITTDTILEKFVNSVNLILALCYRGLYTLVGGLVVAKLSADKPMRQVYILAGIGLFLGVFSSYVNWDKSIGNEWYPILVTITGPICAWLGGKIFVDKFGK